MQIRQRMTFGKFLVCIVCSGVILQTQAAQTVVFTSNASQTQLLELYTSEGCNSCPPADRWFSQLSEDPGLWQDFIPLAFHVTYWNYLGWQDRYSKTEFDDRQRHRAATAGIGVYTPGVFLNGREYRRWRAQPSTPSHNSARDVGQLQATLNGKTVQVNFAPLAKHRDLQVAVALLANGLVTQVRAGENRGKSLNHDFVVAALQQQPMARTGKNWQANITLPQDTTWATQAFAVWVSGDDGAFVQAVGGWL